MGYSVSPMGEKFEIPTEEDHKKEFQRLKSIVEEQRDKGREIVVVMGLGFVGVVMAAIIADSTDKNGNSSKYVIGLQRPSKRSYWKIPLINRGESPVKAEDPEVDPMIKRVVKEKQTFTASFLNDALIFADVVVVDIQCDYTKEELMDVTKGFVEMEALKAAFKIIGQKIPENCLVLIETTVPPGTSENIAFPIVKSEFVKRNISSDPLIAHSYERVMPGKNYVSSIRDFYRVCSGVGKTARERVEKFLHEVLNTKDYPLTVLDRPIESETAKIVENSYRATILAFMDEWSTFAERAGVDLIKVIKAIKVRPTHSNIMFPGPGIGGYCLPKDGALGMWAYKNILGFEDDIFTITPKVIDINDTRGIKAAQKMRVALRNIEKPIVAAKILVLGASYRQDVGDTRYSGSELIVRKLAEMGADIRVHDPYVDHWWEFEHQDTYPAPNHSKARFFRNQEKLKELRIIHDLKAAFKDIDGVIFAVPHSEYKELEPDKVIEMIGHPTVIIDAFALLDDEKIKRYIELGCEVQGLGRGHIKWVNNND